MNAFGRIRPNPAADTVVPDEPFKLRVDRDRFVPLASVAIGMAIGMAVVLGVSRVNGHYFVIVSPFYAFVPVLAVAYAAVVFGRCRNEYLAAGLAVVVASITYWGQFPAALADEIGPTALVSPRLVAKYVALRMNHESMESTFGTGGSAPNRPPTRPESGMNWVFGFAEWGGIMLGSSVLLLYRCRAAYCERCGWWMTRERHGPEASQWRGEKHGICVSALPGGEFRGGRAVRVLERRYVRRRRAIDRSGGKFFTWFTLLGRCAGCSKEKHIVEFECA